jgi:hypothetical protein
MGMKNFCSLTLMLCSLVSLTSSAAETGERGFWFEVQAIKNNPSKVIGYYERDLTDSFGFYVLTEAESDGYRQAYGGPKWKPLPWLEVGVGIGKENMPNAMRRNAFFSIDKDKLSVFGTFENSGSGRWHRVTAVYKINESVGAGMMDETLLGFGPRVEYNLKKNVTLWGALLHDRNNGNTVSTLAVNFSF